MLRALPLFVWGAVLTFEAQAHAFCRTTTVPPPRSSLCPEPCDDTGVPLQWVTATVPYVLHERAFPGLSDAEVRGVLEASFGTWARVRCDGEPVGFRFEQDPGTTDEHAVHHPQGENVNAIALLSAEEWDEAPRPPRALALTTMHFGTETGTIFGADIELNGGLAQFGVCPAEGCAPGEPIVDLENTLTHEIGHLLGLAHTRDPLASLSCYAAEGDVDKRSLGSDDVAGLCAAYPPGEAFPADQSGTTGEDARPASGGGCSASEPANPGRGRRALALAACVALWFGARRARRHPQPPSVGT